MKLIEEDSSYGERIGELIKNKQIEIVNGGYSANDEACSYYEDIIE
jgi:hypothetical protein